MALRYYIYGEVSFATTQRRTSAANRLTTRANQAGFVAEAFQGFAAGIVNVTIAGRPGFRFCYATSDASAANAAYEDVAAAWEVVQDSDSFWGMSATNLASPSPPSGPGS